MNQGDFESETVEAQVHSEVIRDFKSCPSIMSEHELAISISDDKCVGIWEWTDDDFKHTATIDIGKVPYRASWSFTGLYCYLATADGVTVLAQTKDRKNFTLV